MEAMDLEANPEATEAIVERHELLKKEINLKKYRVIGRLIQRSMFG
jgi:hypothetical protein